MVFIGIDVAKDEHDCHAFDSDGIVLCDHFSFSNSRAGFEKFLSLTHSFPKKGKTKVGLESTGHYSHNLLQFLKAHDFEVTVLNPLSVSLHRKADSLRKTKTDKNDARYIARQLVAEVRNPHRNISYHISALKSLTRARFRLTKEIQPVKNRYKRLVHIVFPELQTFFSSLYGNTTLKLLEALPGAKDIADCDIRKLTALLSKFSHGHFGREKAEALKTLAKSSIADYNSGDAFELKLTIRRLNFLSEQNVFIAAEIKSVMDTIGSPITSIPGIGTILGATILAEIGDISAFATPAKLLAFAGCEPSTYESGKFTATNTPMVKRGSRYLRRALYLATNMAFVHNPVFRAYINKKCAEGKHFYTAVSHGIKKMCRLIFSVLTNNKPYSKPL